MPAFDRLISAFASAAAAGALAGLVARQRADACWSFPAYLSTAIAGHALVLVLPGAFVTWGFVLTTDVAQTILRGAIAFEIDRCWELRGLPRERVRKSPARATPGRARG